jgi:hypothetical protein
MNPDQQSAASAHTVRLLTAMQAVLGEQATVPAAAPVASSVAIDEVKLSMQLSLPPTTSEIEIQLMLHLLGRQAEKIHGRGAVANHSLSGRLLRYVVVLPFGDELYDVVHILGNLLCTYIQKQWAAGQISFMPPTIAVLLGLTLE